MKLHRLLSSSGLLLTALLVFHGLAYGQSACPGTVVGEGTATVTPPDRAKCIFLATENAIPDARSKCPAHCDFDALGWVYQRQAQITLTETSETCTVFTRHGCTDRDDDDDEPEPPEPVPVPEPEEEPVDVPWEEIAVVAGLGALAVATWLTPWPGDEVVATGALVAALAN